jgi:nucleoside-diphosphate-sugar epimerase
MRVLVTGAAGFIGGRVCALAPEGTEAIAAVRPGQSAPSVSEVVEADLTAAGLGDALPGELDAVVHLAQSSARGDDEAARAETAALAVGATERLLEHARGAGATRFVLASTATVYARSPDPLSEEAPLDLSGHYARAKRGGELLLAEGRTDLASLALRIFTPYGHDQRDRLIARLIGRVRDGKPVQVEGERGLLLSPVHVDDVALAIHAALARPPQPGFELLNVAAGEALGIREIAEEIGEAVGREPVIEELGGAEPGGLTADVTRLRAALPGLEPRPFAQGIRETAAGG